MNEDEARERWEALAPYAEAFANHSLLTVVGGAYDPGGLAHWYAENKATPERIFEERDIGIVATAEWFFIPRWNALALGMGSVIAALPHPIGGEVDRDDWRRATLRSWLGRPSDPMVRHATLGRGPRGRPEHHQSWPARGIWRFHSRS